MRPITCYITDQGAVLNKLWDGGDYPLVSLRDRNRPGFTSAARGRPPRAVDVESIITVTCYVHQRIRPTPSDTASRFQCGFKYDYMKIACLLCLTERNVDE